MKDITQFGDKIQDVTQFTTGDVEGTPSGVSNALDSPGSTQDTIFAEAIMANEPTTVLEEAGIVRVREASEEVDEIRFPILRNTQMTWNEIDARSGTNDLGSKLNATALNQVDYKTVRPTVKTANIFLPDEVDLVNQTNFEMYAQVGARDAARFKEQKTLETLGSPSVHTQKFTAGESATSAGSLTDTGSTLDPSTLVATRRELSTGSDITEPDYALMHPEQYEDLNTADAFAPGQTSPGAMMRKASWNDDGDIVRFDGMDIFVSELVPSLGSPTTGADFAQDQYTVDGHPVIVGERGTSVGRGEHFGIRVSTQDNRLIHGQYKIFDVSFESTVLAEETMAHIAAAD